MEEHRTASGAIKVITQQHQNRGASKHAKQKETFHLKKVEGTMDFSLLQS